ncbi:MAG: tRNA uridine-5-carboxymethylaminomethyl(34) synthesis GTPase MnmE [Rhizobiales bacterium]|nr:tRNA uridine-5-carboxymethylaminomethyl(34) synthesis GTPase MnmE [Hyphomicrobiales bacterium]
MAGSQTIYALSSGQGRAAIAIVRVSGAGAGTALEMLCGSRPTARRATTRVLRDPGDGSAIDKAVVLWLPGPASSSGEDMVEFHVHGSRAVLAALLTALGGIPGFRPAEAGEFSRRAFANGRIDLVEAEGLADLLRAETTRQRQLALSHLLGEASSAYEAWRKRLVAILAHVEAAVDFVEEGEVATTALLTVRDEAMALASDMSCALRGARLAEEIRAGVRIVLAGPPNTGKSSLLNALAKRQAAIVSAKPGTTRDVIEVPMDIDGMRVTVADTAGLRTDVVDDIEILGIQSSRREIAHGDIVIWVASPDVEGSEVPDDEVRPYLKIVNKSDTHGSQSRLIRNESDLWLSALTGDGIPDLLATLSTMISKRYDRAEETVIVRARQRHAVEESIRLLNESLQHEAGQIELVAEDLRGAATALSRVTGRIEVEDLLSSIFSEFCIGK